MLTEDQLKAMEAGAPLLVKEYRLLQADKAIALAAIDNLSQQLKEVRAARDRAEVDVHRMNKVREALAVLVSVGVEG